MIAIGILSTWLLLSAAGFMGLSALTRAGVREEVEAAQALSELKPAAFAATRIPIPKALAQWR
jgi:hypothetical protein